ncbi:hypothetical protein P7F88_25480 [Vibrio hannami]|uniref:hypothetical protein n=1 Tax=Vibrio hannami TaxID=2717094 RepID=UPI00240F6DE4|nr:hypothetical protein [Vibrio hannami]MDG3089218.1 hypothetical protein [Vibrio hannami]
MSEQKVASISDAPQAFLSKGEWYYKDSDDARVRLTFPKEVDLEQFHHAMVTMQRAIARVELFGLDAPARKPETRAT